MKKTLKLVLALVLLATVLFLLTGCGEGKEDSKEAKKDNVVEISYENGKGTFTVEVPKDEEGNPKYEFTKEKPEGTKLTTTFYLVTDKAVIGFASSGLVYNTNTTYKELYGEDTKATFQGYLDWMDNEKSGIKLNGLEKLTIGGRKAIKYNRLQGSSGDYTYFGYNYRMECDDIYPGSGVDITLILSEEGQKTAPEIDAETKAIIDSIRLVPTAEK